MKLNIITRCIIPDNIDAVNSSIFSSKPDSIEINWHIVFDTKVLKDIDAELLNRFDRPNITLHFRKGDEWGLSQLNDLIQSLDGWIYHLDDDNTIHPKFYKTILKNLSNNPKALAFIFSQNVDGKDFTKLDIREALPENVKVQGIDLSQWLIHSDLHKDYMYGTGYIADGEFITNLYNKEKSKFIFINEVLCNYNALKKPSGAKVPKVLYIGTKEPKLVSTKVKNYEANNLDVTYLKNDIDINTHLAKIRPDVIITQSDSWEDFKVLSSMPLQFRKKWIHILNDETNIGNMVYNSAMASILSPNTFENPDMVSYVTPIYNTGDTLYNTYYSLKHQTYNDWEWVIVNDSTDGGKTLKIAEDIASRDPRVRVYDFREKSGGNIGEVKWRACSLAKGFILAELDHDDLLVPWCTEDLYKAAKKHPEAGFFYNDTAEVDNNWAPQKYPKGFAYSYGSYREEEYAGINLAVANQNNLNPLTIRHIVGVPNHIRAWRRSTYFEIGGHNRNLTVADDYELVVRTFLNTITCKIPKLGYIQFLHNDGGRQNTHDLSRADIQRRVRTIASFYNEQIKDRFEELGLKDWAYEQNPNNPLMATPQHGDLEMVANITYIEE